jgi:hypothetical protein
MRLSTFCGLHRDTEQLLHVQFKTQLGKFIDFSSFLSGQQGEILILMSSIQK